ncbi:F0F1 ATP synthase subunit delta [Pararobbsia silviterrae]|uniref:ATP synthase subunit delta n=1 Tax=Pararobbsia silviterrae TaxID=1792498 RepID=A0A494Y7Y4_9BURK|nr:F0F1 ATP synthase subunit delta [Pararobbsia silviterrae]RKP58486.1 F0F1 ATP synthase subunit delta [Pararobbsia silviterrae]
MAELATIARPYAEALFDVAKTGDLSQWSDFVNELAAFAAQPELLSVAGNPKIGRDQLYTLILSLSKSPLAASEPRAQNFLRAILDNHRLDVLSQVAEQFDALKNAQEGAADVIIDSAFPLDGQPLAELVATLERKFGRKLKPHVNVDPSLIGGVKVTVGDEVLDTSVRARLAQMQVALAA